MGTRRLLSVQAMWYSVELVLTWSADHSSSRGNEDQH